MGIPSTLAGRKLPLACSHRSSTAPCRSSTCFENCWSISILLKFDILGTHPKERGRLETTRVYASRSPSPGYPTAHVDTRTCLFGLFMLDASLARTLLDAIPAETVNPSSFSTARRITAVKRAPASRALSNALVVSTRWPAAPLIPRTDMRKKSGKQVTRTELLGVRHSESGTKIIDRVMGERRSVCACMCEREQDRVRDDETIGAERETGTMYLKAKQHKAAREGYRQASPNSPVDPSLGGFPHPLPFLPPLLDKVSPSLPSSRDTPRRSKPFRLDGNAPVMGRSMECKRKRVTRSGKRVGPRDGDREIEKAANHLSNENMFLLWRYAIGLAARWPSVRSNFAAFVRFGSLARLLITRRGRCGFDLKIYATSTRRCFVRDPQNILGDAQGESSAGAGHRQAIAAARHCCTKTFSAPATYN